MPHADAPTAAVPALLVRLDEDDFTDLPESLTAAGRALLAAHRGLRAFASEHPTDPYTGHLLPDTTVERLVTDLGDSLGRGEQVPADLLVQLSVLRSQQQHAEEALEVLRALLNRWRAAWDRELRLHADAVLTGTLDRQREQVIIAARDLITAGCTDAQLRDLAEQLALTRYLQAEVLAHAIGERADSPLLAGAAWFPDFAERWPAWGQTVLPRLNASSAPTPPPWPGEPVEALRHASAVTTWSPATHELLSAYSAAVAAWQTEEAERAEEARLMRLRGELDRFTASGGRVDSWRFQQSPWARQLLDAGLITPVARQPHAVQLHTAAAEPVRVGAATDGES